MKAKADQVGHERGTTVSQLARRALEFELGIAPKPRKPSRRKPGPA